MNTLFEAMLVCLIITLLSISYYFIKTVKNEKKKTELQKFELDINTNIDNNSLNALDIFITNCFADYLILNVEYNENLFVNKDLENKIRKDVLHLVVDRISSTLLSKLSLIYNMNKFNDILAEKVYLKVSQYVIEKNSIKDQIDGKK